MGSIGKKAVSYREKKMGKKGNWFDAVKRLFNTESKENKCQKNTSKKRWGFIGCSHFDRDSFDGCTHDKPPPAVPREGAKLNDLENDQSEHAYFVALASAVAAEVAAVAAQAAATVVRLTSSANFSRRSKEDVAAIKIQTAFRGYLD